MLLSYRSFASALGVVAAFVSGVVLFAGIAAVALLVAQGYPLRALLALALTLTFAFVIALLVPRTIVTLYDDGTPALTIAQRAVFPSSEYVVATPNGATLAVLRKSALSRLGRNRWVIHHEGRFLGDAREESLFRALRRKLLGKFSRRFETNVEIAHGGLPAGRIVRRRDASTPLDTLELTNDVIDRRVAVALATLVLGKEP